jgi:hypothetical protein
VRRRFFSLLCGLVLFAIPAAAHHTFVTKYDNTKQVTVSGEVGSVSYSNPHIFFEVAGWRVETESIPVANAKGLTKERLTPGAKVKVTGWKARDGKQSLGLHSISFAGGPLIVMRATAR